jgi:hypothetical protein
MRRFALTIRVGGEEINFRPLIFHHDAKISLIVTNVPVVGKEITLRATG